MDVDSLSPTPDDTCNIQSFDKENEIDTEIELQDILRLHRQVSDDVELKLKTADNFHACYMKYFKVYRNISKSRGQAPLATPSIKLNLLFLHTYVKEHSGLF